MLVYILLLFTTASALCSITIVTAKGYEEQDNEYTSSMSNSNVRTSGSSSSDNNVANNNNNEIIAQQPTQRVQQQQRQQHEQQQFEPFEDANLRRLQQINEYYGNSNSNYNEDNNNKYNINDNGLLQRKQQRLRMQLQLQLQRHDDDNRNSNSYGNNNNSENYNNRQQQWRQQQQQQEHNGNNVHAALSSHPYARNNFRLQLSDLNEPFSNVDDSRRISGVANSNGGIGGGGIGGGSGGASTAANNNFYTNHQYSGNIEKPNHSNIHIGNDDNDVVGDIATVAATAINTDKAGADGHAISVRSSKSYSNMNLPKGEDNARIDRLATFNDIYNDDETPTDTADDELGMNLPYGIQNVRKRTVRGSPTNVDRRSKSTTYQSLCPTKRVTIPLETVGYEYRPNHFIEVTCAHNYAPAQNFEFNKNKICSEAGFSCIQLNRTIHLIRRNKAATVECWESEIRIVPSGCECMWPKHSYGDIIAYHDSQKRYNTPEYTLRAITDYQAGSSDDEASRRLKLISDLEARRKEELEGVGFDAYDYETN